MADGRRALVIQITPAVIRHGDARYVVVWLDFSEDDTRHLTLRDALVWIQQHAYDGETVQVDTLKGSRWKDYSVDVAGIHRTSNPQGLAISSV